MSHVHATTAAPGVTRLQLDRPPANALDAALLAELARAIDAAVAGGAQALILTGRPGMFSGGLDVPALLPLPRAAIREFWDLFFGVARALAAAPVPVLAAVSGHAPAGGAILALHCDFRIAAAGRYRMGLNEVQVGLPVPPSILAALASVVGPQAARRLAVRGELVPMAEALALGLVDELVAPEELDAITVERALALTALPPVAMNTTRRNCKAGLLERLAGPGDAELATDWWFSHETQAGMRRLVERLGKS